MISYLLEPDFTEPEIAWIDEQLQMAGLRHEPRQSWNC
jgi:hypothetical protein